MLINPGEIRNGEGITISGSKSESNRLLILQKLFPSLVIENLSDSDDVRAMVAALKQDGDEIDIHHAGTTMRFLTAYFALCSERNVTLTGSSRMKERPIEVLVNALRQLGAVISYKEKEGYPPLQIAGKYMQGGVVELPANVSSQYITALLLVGTKLPLGIELHLKGEITSRPYIEMTLAFLQKIGVKTFFEGQLIKVAPLEEVTQQTIVVESDWSSVSYFYSIVALSPIGTTLRVKYFKADSIQGDAQIANIFQAMGVETTFQEDDSLLLERKGQVETSLSFDLINTPDLAQTIAVCAFGLGVSCYLTGLHTLKIKETDRLVALQNELSKLGAEVAITEDTLRLATRTVLKPNQTIATYQDHRMAMAFAPIGLLTAIKIQDAEVVTKSFVNFWDVLEQIGVNLSEA